MKQTPFVTAQTRRLVAEFRRDRRKMTVLGVLLLVGLVLVIRSAFTAGPAPAHALPKRSANSLAAANESARRAKSFLDEEYISRINRNQTRDLFLPSEPFFPPPPASVKAVSAAGTEAEASEDQPEEIQRQNVLKDAEALRLQSTMLGSRTVASINNFTLAIGDEIIGFRVIDIQANRCTVEKNGVAVMLTIVP